LFKAGLSCSFLKKEPKNFVTSAFAQAVARFAHGEKCLLLCFRKEALS
jgi:hypothetical protein